MGTLLRALWGALDRIIDAGAARITAWRQGRCGRSVHGHAYVYAPPSTRAAAAQTKSGHYLDFLGDQYACRHCGKRLYLLHGARGEEAREEVLLGSVAWEEAW